MEALGVVTWGVALAVLAFNAGMWAIAVRRIHSWRTLLRESPGPDRWPAVHVLVCVKDSLPTLRDTVLALDLQDYPGEYRVTFVTEETADAGDRAAAHLRTVLPATRRCGHVVAGRVLDSGLRCAQKNFNLLAGIRHADKTPADGEVFAFCDGDLRVESDWLREMVRPIATGTSEATTTLHYATPAERRILGTLHGMVESAQSLASLVCRGSTWGGSMAIRRSDFHRLKLADVWSRTCVDDITMSRVLREAGLRVRTVPQYLVSAPSDIGTYRGFVRWLGRQFFFVKVYLPSRFHLLWVKCTLDCGALWLATFHVSYRLLRGEWAAGPGAAFLSIAAAGAALGLFLAFRHLMPERPPLRAWVGATFLLHGTSILACADATLRRKRLRWRDLTYDLERGGRVLTVAGNARPAESRPPAAPAEENAPEEAIA